MIEKLTAKEACDECALIEYWYESLDCNQRPAFDRWFGWLRERIADEVQAEIDLLVTKANRERDEARKELETLRAELQSSRRLLNAANETIALRDEIVDGLSDKTTALQWERDNLAARVKELEADRDRAVDSLCEEATGRLDAEKEVARLKAELEATTAKPAPKPRRTGGQKVRESLEYHAGHSGHDISDEAFALFAMEWGIPDEPEPPSDGELMRRAYGNGYLRDGDLWVGIADEFLKLRAERDGGGA